jgi:hypothetical protein
MPRRTPWTILRTPVCFRILSTSLTSVLVFSVWTQPEITRTRKQHPKKIRKPWEGFHKMPWRSVRVLKNIIRKNMVMKGTLPYYIMVPHLVRYLYTLTPEIFTPFPLSKIKVFFIKSRFNIFGAVSKKIWAMTTRYIPSTSRMLNQNIVWEPKKCFHSDVIVGKQPPYINNVENLEWLFPN